MSGRDADGEWATVQDLSVGGKARQATEAGIPQLLVLHGAAPKQKEEFESSMSSLQSKSSDTSADEEALASQEALKELVIREGGGLSDRDFMKLQDQKRRQWLDKSATTSMESFDLPQFQSAPQERLAAAASPVVALPRAEVQKFAVDVLGMSVPEDNALMWIAEQCLLSPLPPNWTEETVGDMKSYTNLVTGVVTTAHPLVDTYRTLYIQHKMNNGRPLSSRTEPPAGSSSQTRGSESSKRLPNASSDEMNDDAIDDMADTGPPKMSDKFGMTAKGTPLPTFDSNAAMRIAAKTADPNNKPAPVGSLQRSTPWDPVAAPAAFNNLVAPQTPYVYGQAPPHTSNNFVPPPPQGNVLTGRPSLGSKRRTSASLNQPVGDPTLVRPHNEAFDTTGGGTPLPAGKPPPTGRPRPRPRGDRSDTASVASNPDE